MPPSRCDTILRSTHKLLAVCGGRPNPDARLGYAYVMNKLDFYLLDDPREKALRDAIYGAIVKAQV